MRHLDRRALESGRLIAIAMALTATAALSIGCGSDCPDEVEWTPAFDAQPLGWFLSVWGPADNDLYAVGGEPDAGLMMNFDGSEWSAVDLGVDVPLLNWVFGFSANDITAVGREGTIIHWDGAAWTVQTTPTVEDMWGVWGAAPDDLWAVGGRGREEGQATLLHFDGTDWTDVALPTLERANVFALFKVWGSSASNIYVVGQRGVVLHYDGSVWTEELVGASTDLIAVWGTGPDRVVAVGGRGTGTVSVFDGSEWRTESLAPNPGLNGVWLDNNQVAHVVGTVGTLAVLDLETFELTRSIVPTDRDFHAVFSATGNSITAVGGNLFAVEPPFEGIAFERQLGEEE